MPELLVEIIKDANGRKPTPGSQVSVHYVGSLTNGTIFDSSRQRDQPFKFQIGKGMVIQGWDKGVMGMSVGQTCRLTIPPHLGYGASGTGGVIPPNATLVFEVELLEIS
jgi:FKBP-type peptidyl-prolyl cis-trans isomerase